jgi:transposase
MKRRSLTSEQQRQLEHQLQETLDARVYRRTLAVLEYSRGRPLSQIAQMLGVTRQSIYNWLEVYEQRNDPKALEEAPRPGRPRVWTQERQEVLRTLMETSPDQLGAFAVNWTVPLLQNYLEQATGERIGEDTIRGELRRQRYVWKRPRYVLEPDPQKEKKTLDPSSNRAYATGPSPAG